MLGEPLQNGTGSLDQRTDHDGPATTEALSEPRRDGNSKNGAKLVACVEEAQQVGLNGIFALGVLVSIPKVYAQSAGGCWNRGSGS